MRAEKLNDQEHQFWVGSDGLTLEAWRNTNVPGWAGEFKRVFNGEFKSFRTWGGLKNDIARLVEKFDMVAANEDFSPLS